MTCFMEDSLCSVIRDPIAVEWIKVLTIVIGGIFAFYRWYRDAQGKRSMQFRKLIDDFQNDKDVKQFLYVLDDDEKIWFFKDFVGDPHWGAVLDKLLFHFCYVIYLYKELKFISEKEFSTLSYMIDRPLQNPQLQDYLYNLKMYADGRGIQHPYKYLVDYGCKKKYLGSQFKDEKKKKQPCDELNFHEYYKDWLKSEKEFRDKYYAN